MNMDHASFFSEATLIEIGVYGWKLSRDQLQEYKTLNDFFTSFIFTGHKNVMIDMNPRGGGGVLPYMGYIGMCRCEGYGFQAVYSGIGYINQSVWI